MSKVIRSVKNVTKGYTATQIKVRNATSNDPWGPTGSDMSDIARMTFDTNHDFFQIMEMLDRRLNDKGKNWRHVLKALKVLDYCLHEGSAHVVVWAKDNIYIIKTLREFQYIDEEGKDQGLNVRVAAKELTGLITDEERLRSERKDRKSWKSRVMGLEEGISSEGPRPERSERRVRPQRPDEDDLEYKLAIEASKNLAEEEAAKRNKANFNESDDDLEKALKLSKEEEELRQRQLESSNEASLFDDIPTPTQSQPTQVPFQQTGFGQPQQWQQGGAVDLFGNPIAQQPTGYLQNVYSQPTGFDGNHFQQQQQQQVFQQPQATGWSQQQQFGQSNAFDQQPQQHSFLQPQQTAFNHSNPYSANAFGVQNTGFQQSGDQNLYGNNTQSQSQEALKPMPTGSNNPFAQFTNTSTNTGFGSGNTISPQRPGPPTLGQLQQSPQPQPQTTNFASAFQQQPPTQTQNDGKHAHLNQLLASGNESGQDTFGNIGNLRIPAQHTAPGTFINSAGTGRTGSNLAPQVTGNNPFLSSQYTGMPQQQFSAGGRMQPAQTGPAGVNGFGGSPFPQVPQPQFGDQQQSAFGGYGQQQQSQQPNNNNLIEF